MKNAKLSLFVLALTLSVGVSSGVYASERNNDTKCIKPTSVEHKIEFKNEKNKEWDAKFLKNHEDGEFANKKIVAKDEKNQEWAKKYTENHKKDCKDIKIELTAEQKAALKVKMDKIAEVKDANKALKIAIAKNAEAVKVELKRIEDSKIVLDPTIKAEAEAVLLAVKDATTKKDCVKPAVAPVVAPAVTPVVTPVVAPVVPVVEPTVPVVPVEKTYIEKLNEKLDNAILKYTEKNTALTTLAARLLSLLSSLTLIK